MELYRGVIENNISPKKDGRLQVRIIGIHDYDKSKVKTEDLPWAEVLQSTSFGFSSGIGFSSIPNIGTWVFIVLDHDNPNKPIVIGAISGRSVKPSNPSVGFNDPTGKFPLVDRLNEEDQNRLQRVQDLDKTIHKTINDSLDIFTKIDNISGADVSQTEPKSLSNLSKYPDNAVIETKSGHVIEVDDTPSNERIRVYHKTGSYLEMRPDGTIINKLVGSDKNHYIYYGDVDKHIKKSVKTYIEENLDEIITGSVKRYIDKTLDEHIKGNVIQTMNSNQTIKIDGNLDLTVGGNLTWHIGKNINIKSGGTQTVSNGGNYKHTAPRIDFN